MAWKDVKAIPRYHMEGIVHCLANGVFGPIADARHAHLIASSSNQGVNDVQMDKLFPWMRGFMAESNSVAVEAMLRGLDKDAD